MLGYPCICVLSFFLTLGCCKLLGSENLVDNCSTEMVGEVAKESNLFQGLLAKEIVIINFRLLLYSRFLHFYIYVLTILLWQ